ncbi:hypothetical protein [uncultured Aquimarina sp.]|uniref:hypothetical protein n=1 Tax=uncultured Aquimarina sp. TaxID=575652 RepID=UPI00263926DC|nr:hypothetical protein [uncultured Aquimarina sp.]
MKKINLKSIAVALTRDEMRIMKGGSGGDGCNTFCTYDTQCRSYYCIKYNYRCLSGVCGQRPW